MAEIAPAKPTAVSLLRDLVRTAPVATNPGGVKRFLGASCRFLAAHAAAKAWLDQQPLGGEDAEACPICLDPFKDDDLCATDVTEGTCHARCLEGSTVVDLDTGEPTDGEPATYRYDSLPRPKAAHG